MIIKEKEHLILDHIKGQYTGGQAVELSPENGLGISVKTDTEPERIAFVLWDDQKEECYIKTVGTKFQDWIISWDLFKEFVELVDEAYYRVKLAVKLDEFDSYLD